MFHQSKTASTGFFKVTANEFQVTTTTLANTLTLLKMRVILLHSKNKGLDVPQKLGVRYDYNVAWGTATKRNRRRKWLLRALFSTVAFIAGCFLVAKFASQQSTEPSSGVEVAIALPGSAERVEHSRDLAADEGASERLPNEPEVPNTGGESTPAEPLAETPAAPPKQLREVWRNLPVAPGDNLSLIFSREGLSKRDLHTFLQLGGTAKNLTRIKPGAVIRVRADEDGHIIELVQEVDYLTSLHIRLEDDGYVAELIEIEPEIRTRTAVASIENSLYLAGQKAQLTDRTIMALTDIFGWDIDFVLDIRRGDRFSIIFEEIYKENEKVREGKILAAEFINQDRQLRAVYYENDDGHVGYYSDDGRAMQRAFLRTPVNFSRISSKFNLKRKHPVLNRIRAHKGVDYAAPHGTPIRATANGKVQFVGTKGGYGRTVIMQHGDSYSTLYAHMSRFGSGVKRGKRVQQGQTIGYVGKTGLATGPHLHYEFRINGIHRNPLTVKLPQALPIEKKYLDDFKRKSAPLIAKLEELDVEGKSGSQFIADASTRTINAN
ncbi:MAG: OapA family protein [Gammaproteobacteria bacterium]